MCLAQVMHRTMTVAKNKSACDLCKKKWIEFILKLVLIGKKTESKMGTILNPSVLGIQIRDQLKLHMNNQGLLKS